MNARKSTCLILLCIALIPLVLLTGCAKRDAQKAMTLSQTARDEASAAQAPGYAPTAFNDADRLFKQAQDQFNAGSYKESIDNFQQAEVRFRRAVEVAREVKPRIDELIGNIEEALAKANENLDKARTGGALAAEDINPVQTLMDGLNQRMESEIRSEVDEVKLNAFLAEIEQAVTRTDSLALAHLKPQAATAKQETQTLITRAQELKADTHVPDQYGQVMAKFQELESAELEGQWQKVIDLSAEMKDPLNQIIQVSQEKAAGDILRQVGEQIVQAKQMNLQGVEAFASAIQRAESSVQAGQTALQSSDFSGAINGSDMAKAALREAYQAVGQQAQQLVDASKANLEKAIEQEAEQYAASVVSQVREAIAASEELLKQENFVSAFNTARQAEKASGQAVDAARRGKAQLALNTVEQPFSALHGQGGSQYAADAYQQALAKVQTLRDMMKNGEYEAVVDGSPDAAAVVQSALESLSGSVSQYIARAEQAIDSAKAAGAPEWVGVQFANASNLKAAAERDRAAKKFLSSIQNAESAIKIAQDSEAKAYQLQTDQNLRKADDFLAVARRAEQDRLSPLAYRKALESREESVRLLQQNQFKNAFENSIETVQKSDRAFNNLVMTANEKTDSALAAEAMTYSESEMKQALAFLNKAEAAQKSQDFASANELAIESANWAEKAENFTWKQRSFRLLRDLEGVRGNLEYHLAPEKTPASYESFLTNLAEAKVQQLDENYKASYEYAAKADEARNAAINGMNQELIQVLADLRQTADWMGENAMDADGRQIKLDLLDSIPELEQKIALKDWRAAYSVAAGCQQTADRARRRLEQRNRSIMAKDLQVAVHPYEKNGVLGVVPNQKEQIKETFGSLKKPGSETPYSDIYQKFLNTSSAVVALPSTIVSESQQRTDEIASILQQANEAGANQYYKEWYRDLATDLQMLRNAIQGENFADIATYVRRLDREAPRLLVATQLAADENEFLTELEKNLNQMNNVFQEFGFLGNMSKRLLLASRLTEHKLDETHMDMYRVLQGNMSVNTLKINAELLEDNVIGLKPPKTMVKVHKKAKESFKIFRKAAESFVIYGESDAYDILYRERAISDGYNNLKKSLKLNSELLFEIKEARKLKGWEKFMRGVNQVESKFGEFYFNWGER